MLIRNGTLIDGTGESRFRADLIIETGKIVAIGRNLAADGREVVDASGLIVAPGFIDTQSHSDLLVLEDPLIAPKLRQGISSEIIGQDGLSVAPLNPQYVADWKKNLASLAGSSEKVPWTWTDTSSYLDTLEQAGLVLNEGYLVPHGNLRMEVMGLEDRPASAEELVAMQAALRRDLEAGALGLSTGLIYVPCTFADTRELEALAQVVAEYGGVFSVHQRSEANQILESMDEILGVARKTGVRVHFSHLKICGKANWPKFDAVLAKLDRAKSEGLQLSFDLYPYEAGATMLGAILPSWAHAGGTSKLLGRLMDPTSRHRLITEIQAGPSNWDNFVEFAGLDGIWITSVKTQRNLDVVGLNLAEIGDVRRKDPLEAALDLILEEENGVGMIDVYGSEDQIRTLLRRPEANLCTDGFLGGRPHPRGYGAFPRFLRWVREEAVLSLEEAVRKMTGQPAAVFGLADRGTLAVGKVGDVVLFDPATIEDRATFKDPQQFPTGIAKLYVAGETIWDGKKLHESGRPGQVLRRKP